MIRRLLSKDRDARYLSLEDVQFDCAPVLLDLKHQQAAALLPQASSLLREHRFEQAHSLIRKILDLQPSNVEARRLKEVINREVKQQTIRPRVAALLRQAETEAARRNYPYAIRAVESALKLIPADTSLQAYLEKLQTASLQMERAARLTEQAQEFLLQNNLPGALQTVTAALNADPDNATAQQLLPQIRGEIEAREQQRRLREGVSRAEDLLARGAFEEAGAVLENLASENPASAEVEELVERWRRTRQEEETRRRLAGEIASCEQHLNRREWSAAVTRLEALSDEFPQQEQVLGLLARARAAQRDNERKRHCEQIGIEAWTLYKTKEFDRAIEILDRGLQIYPDEPRLLGLTQAIASLKAEYEKREVAEREQARAIEEAERKRALAIDEAVEQARALLDTGQLVAGLPQEFPKEPELQEIWHPANAGKGTLKLQSDIGKCLASGDVDRARELLDKARESDNQPEELAALEGEVQRAHFRREKLTDIKTLAAKGAYGKAEWAVTKFLEQYPNDPEAAAQLKAIGEARERQAREERLKRGRAEAQRLVAAEQFDAAIRTLNTLLEEFRSDADLLKEVHMAQAEKERREKVEVNRLGRRYEGLKEARAATAAGDHEQAEQTLLQLLEQYPNDAEIAAQLNAVRKAREQQARQARLREREEKAALARGPQQPESPLETLKTRVSRFLGRNKSP
jgi:tetratricopeptide (TPR) repeat protein